MTKKLTNVAKPKLKEKSIHSSDAAFFSSFIKLIKKHKIQVNDAQLLIHNRIYKVSQYGCNLEIRRFLRQSVEIATPGDMSEFNEY